MSHSSHADMLAHANRAADYPRFTFIAIINLKVYPGFFLVSPVSVQPWAIGSTHGGGNEWRPGTAIVSPIRLHMAPAYRAGLRD